MLKRRSVVLIFLFWSHHVAAQLFNVPPGTSVAQQPHLAGSVVAQTTTSFSYRVSDVFNNPPLTVSGAVGSRVVKAVDDTYDFYWQISVDPNLSIGVGGIAFDRSFGESAVFSWRTDLGGTVAPTFVGFGSTSDRFSFLDVDELMTGFLTTHLQPGTQSVFFFVDSDATAYATDMTFTLSSAAGLGERASGRSGPYPTFGPAGGGACPRPSLLSRVFSG